MSPVVLQQRYAEAERFVDFFSAVFCHIHVHWDARRLAFTTPGYGDILIVGETPQSVIADRLSAIVGGIRARHFKTLQLACVGTR
jgi:hypothetical protein